MWKQIVEPDRPQMTNIIIRRMRFACWVFKVTKTHSDYVMLIAFTRQQRKSASVLCDTKIARLVHPCRFMHTSSKNQFNRLAILPEQIITDN